MIIYGVYAAIGIIKTYGKRHAAATFLRRGRCVSNRRSEGFAAMAVDSRYMTESLEDACRSVLRPIAENILALVGQSFGDVLDSPRQLPLL